MQTRIDSVMESVVNIIIGSAIYTVVNYFILAAILGIPISPGKSLFISAVFTLVSLVRSYAIRRAFNGRSVWSALKALRPLSRAERDELYELTWRAVADLPLSMSQYNRMIELERRR